MVAEPVPRRWTRGEYHRASDLGLFRPDERLELIDGEIVQKVSPQSDAHAAAVGLSADALAAAFGPGFHVREEKPIVLSDLSEPEPDVVVVRGARRAMRKHPTPSSAVLVMEVADSSLAYDRTEKAASFAGSGIADYWLLNLKQRCLEVRRDPGRLPAGSCGYRSVEIIEENGEIAPLAAGAPVRVADLLPGEV